MQIGNEVRRYRVKPLVIRHSKSWHPDPPRTRIRKTQSEGSRRPPAGFVAEHAEEDAQ